MPAKYLQLASQLKNLIQQNQQKDFYETIPALPTSFRRKPRSARCTTSAARRSEKRSQS